MLQTNYKINKKNFYKDKYDAFYKYISWYIGEKQTRFTYERFFKTLHQYDIQNLYDKTLNLKINQDLNNSAGKFRSHLNPNSTKECQSIEIKVMDYYKNTTYKNLLELILYLHETTHEKQRDYFVYNNRYNIPEENEYNKYLNLEICGMSDKNIYGYSYRLIELDAIYNSVKRFIDIQQKGNITITGEYAAHVLRECLVFFQSLNHTEDFKGINPVTDCRDLVNIYRLSFDKMCSSLHMVSFEKYKEIRNINFDKLEDEINEKCNYMKNVFNHYYKALLNCYHPSKEACKQLNIPDDLTIKQLNKHLKNKPLFECANILSYDFNSYLAFMPDEETKLNQQEKEI